MMLLDPTLFSCGYANCVLRRLPGAASPVAGQLHRPLQKDKAGRPDIDSFEAAMIRSERTKGFFVSFDYTSDAITEIQRFFKQTGRVIVPLTVSEILNDEIAMKLV